MDWVIVRFHNHKSCRLSLEHFSQKSERLLIWKVYKRSCICCHRWTYYMGSGQTGYSVYLEGGLGSYFPQIWMVYSSGDSPIKQFRFIVSKLVTLTVKQFMPQFMPQFKPQFMQQFMQFYDAFKSKMLQLQYKNFKPML